MHSKKQKNNRKELIICLGSACFSRGNRDAVNTIKNYIKEHQLEDKIYFRGCHCMNKCQDGPNLKFEDKIFSGVNSGRLLYVLDEIFHKYL
ncbi:MAG: NAD(P)H-dependent oxidoreductase subunit E [Bacteroidales bacterium]